MLPRKDYNKLVSSSMQFRKFNETVFPAQIKQWKLQNDSGIPIQLNSTENGKLVENLKNISNIINYSNQRSTTMQNKVTTKSIAEQHENLLQCILSEEAELIDQHKNYVGNNMENIQSEMVILQNVDQPNSDVSDYVKSLSELLSRKEEEVAILRGKLRILREHIEQEKAMTAEFGHLNGYGDYNLVPMIE
jgi:hypothetical protein